MTPSTGESASAKVKRINCRNCGYRIHADAEVCPHCHVDPHTRRPLPSNLLIAILIVLVLAFVCVLVSQFLVNPMTQFAALGLKPQPTTVIQVIYAVVTSPPPTPPPSVAPTITLLPTLTFTPRFSPTPTRKGAPTITPTPPVPSPTSSDYGVPKLIAPANGANFSGADADISLEWQGVAANGLRENEWYLVTVSYTSRNGGATTKNGWSRETRWNVDKSWWSDASASARTFSWSVQLMRVEGADPYASPTRTPISPPSETRKFVWQ